MKKSKLSIGLVTSFIGALALTSCGDTPAVTSSKTSVIDYFGYNNETGQYEINADELYREFGESKDGTSKYYNAVLESLIRYEYPKLAEDENPKEPDLKKYSRIKSEANDKVRAVRQTAQDNANNNGTDFDEEWDKILENNGVDSEEDLRLKFIYELEKEAMTEWYFKKYSETTGSGQTEKLGLRQEYVGVSATDVYEGENENKTLVDTKDWKEIDPATENVNALYPYHVIHILVKLSADATDYTRAQISESEAKKLWEVVSHLVDGQFTFEQVAAEYSDDTSSSEYGDVELMSTKTSFYNEFKLGTWAYDAILSGINHEITEEEAEADPTKIANEKLYKAFGIDKDDEVVLQTMSDENGFRVETKGKIASPWNDGVDDHKSLIEETMVDNVNVHLNEANKLIPAIPFDVFRQINKMAEKDKIGTFTPEGSSASLPRNVLFNAFLNFRSPFVITNELLDRNSVDFGEDNIKTAKYDFDGVVPNGEGYDAEDLLVLQRHNFRSGKLGDGFEKKVLCDTNENVIIGVRSTAGIHFMVMRKSVFEATNRKAYEKVAYVGDSYVVDEDNSTPKTFTSLENYYTTKIPTDSGYPTGHQTYVNIKTVSDVSYYTDRANTIKNDIKSSNFDAAYDYRIYETLLSFDFGDGKIGDIIHFTDEVRDPVTGEVTKPSEIEKNIKKTIKELRENAQLSQEESINNAWKEYLIQLLNQNELRNGDIDGTMFKKAFVPTTCAFSFNSNNKDEWKEGGKCYVK